MFNVRFVPIRSPHCDGRLGLREEKIMTFVITHRVSTFRNSMLHAGRRAAGRLRARSNLTPQERANLYVSRMPLAVITASLGGHPYSSEETHG